jgi:hypothetical protein
MTGRWKGVTLTAACLAWLTPCLLAQPRVRSGAPGRGAISKKNALERFQGLSPEQRQRALDRLPPERRKQVEKRIESYNQLTPEERDRLQGRLNDFSKWSPARKEKARDVFRRFQEIPAGRRQALREEFMSWRSLTDDELESRVASDEYHSKYSDTERNILEELVRLRTSPEP